jgi:hypothetical protein
VVVFPRIVINYEDDECRGTTSLATPIPPGWPLIQGDDGPTRSDLLSALTDRRDGGRRWRRGEGQK